MKKSIPFITFFAAITINAHAASSAITVYLENRPLEDASGLALTSGDANARGDGAIIQIGYFSTDTNVFTGSWIPIAGSLSSNPLLIITVGDFNDAGAIPDGFVGQTSIFDDGSGTDVGLPPADTQLAVRVFDTTSEANLSTANYNTVTKSSWLFQNLTSPQPTTTFTLDSINTIWQDGGANAFKTTITAVPEPSSFALLGLGGMALLFRRRK